MINDFASYFNQSTRISYHDDSILFFLNPQTPQTHSYIPRSPLASSLPYSESHPFQNKIISILPPFPLFLIFVSCSLILLDFAFYLYFILSNLNMGHIRPGYWGFRSPPYSPLIFPYR
jgi:hypothetical protein